MNFFKKAFGGGKSHAQIYAEVESVRSAGGQVYSDKLREAALAGSPEANFELGAAIADGLIQGTKKEARNYIEAATKLNLVSAKTYLGWSYVTGSLGEKDVRKAFAILMEAHRDGDARASNNIGYMQLKGMIGEPDPKTAIEYYKVASQRGDAYAPFNIGALQMDGDGIPVNMHSALKWFQIAAERGNANASKNVAFIKFHLETEDIQVAAARAIGQKYAPRFLNKKNALRDLDRLTAVVDKPNVRRSLSSIKSKEDLLSAQDGPCSDILMLAHNISYFTGLEADFILMIVVSGNLARLKVEVAEGMPA